jgi:hypothetical protein
MLNDYIVTTLFHQRKNHAKPDFMAEKRHKWCMKKINEE